MDIAIKLVVNCKSNITIDRTLYASTWHSIAAFDNLVFYYQFILTV